jgi:hypothetical protein
MNIGGKPIREGLQSTVCTTAGLLLTGSYEPLLA